MDKVKDRIRKLLAQAEDRQGTPEGDVFYDKAFELLARYGFECSDVQQEDNKVEQRTVPIDGAYSGMQAALLIELARALHCTGFNTGPRVSKIVSVTLFGRACHLERVVLLYGMLRLSMLCGARNITGTDSVVIARRSFMRGFISRIGSRLAQAETTVASEVAGRGLALIDDAHLAYLAQVDFLNHNGLTLDERRLRQGHHPLAYSAGLRAGDGVDIGQERIGAQREILPPF